MNHRIRSRAHFAGYNLYKNIAINGKYLKIFQNFAKNNNLIYFGTINKNSDDYKIIRGFSLVKKHQDYHYVVGTIQNYNISLIDRVSLFDDIKDSHLLNLTICAIDLKSNQNIPNFYIESVAKSNNFINLVARFNKTIHKIKFGTFENYSDDFLSRFSIYTKLENFLTVERLFPANSASILSAHLWPMSVEVSDGILYIYNSEKNINYNKLNILINVGLWLAQHLDYMSMQI